MDYLYLHGFASGPQSSKAQFFRRQFESIGNPLHILDLNQTDFAHLTLTRQIQQGVEWILERKTVQDGQPNITIIGSSFGGITAAWIAQNVAVQPYIHRLILLAPAFQFLAQWLPRLGQETVDRWRRTGWLSVYHYGMAQQTPLAYDFVTDAETYDETLLTTPISTLILHGRRDEVIDIQVSRDYANSRPWVKLVELEGDHSLGNVQPELWSEVRSFLNCS